MNMYFLLGFVIGALIVIINHVILIYITKSIKSRHRRKQLQEQSDKGIWGL